MTNSIRHFMKLLKLVNIPVEGIKLLAKSRARQKTPCLLQRCGLSLVSSVPKKWRLTRWPLDPSRAIPRSTYIHPPSLAKIRQRTSEEWGNKQTDRQTNAARFIVWYLGISWNAWNLVLFVTQITWSYGFHIYISDIHKKFNVDAVGPSFS